MDVDEHKTSKVFVDIVENWPTVVDRKLFAMAI